MSMTANNNINNFTVSTNGTATITNAGLLEKTGVSWRNKQHLCGTRQYRHAAGRYWRIGSGQRRHLNARRHGHRRGALELSTGSVLIDTAVFNVATLSVQTAGAAAPVVTLAENLVYAGAFQQTAGSIDLSSHTLDLTGSAQLNGTIGGGGTVAIGAGVTATLAGLVVNTGAHVRGDRDRGPGGRGRARSSAAPRPTRSRSRSPRAASMT